MGNFVFPNLTFLLDKNTSTTFTAHPAVCLRVASPEDNSSYFLYMLPFLFCWGVFLCLLKELGVGREPLLLWFCKALWDIDSKHHLTKICWRQTEKVHLHHLLLCFCYSAVQTNLNMQNILCVCTECTHNSTVHIITVYRVNLRKPVGRRALPFVNKHIMLQLVPTTG